MAGYWILPPVGQFAIASPADRLGLAIFTGMGLLMSAVAELYRRNRSKAAAYDREVALRGAGKRCARAKSGIARLFNTIDEGFCIVEMIFDAEGKPIDYRFLEVNAAFEQQTGLHEARGEADARAGPGS